MNLRVSAYAILVEADSIVLCRLSKSVSNAGSWTLPGGGIEFGEHPEQAARREVYEETGLRIETDEVLAINTIVGPEPERNNELTQAIRIIYSGRIVGGDLRNELEGSTDLCRWIPLADCDDHPAVELARAGIALAREQLMPTRCKEGS